MPSECRNMIGVPHKLTAEYLNSILIMLPLSECNIKRLYCIRFIFHSQDFLWSAVITTRLCKCVIPCFTFILLRHTASEGVFYKSCCSSQCNMLHAKSTASVQGIYCYFASGKLCVHQRTSLPTAHCSSFMGSVQKSEVMNPHTNTHAHFSQ